MGFQQGLSGLNASAKALDVIGNNIANTNTVGYKTGSAQFADVFAASLSGAGAAPVGLGSKVAGVVQQFTQGNITTTNNPLDIAINGGGFFQMDDGLGGTVYSRNGQFQLDKAGYVVNAQGLQLKGVAADSSGAIQTGGTPEALQLFDPTQSLSGPPQMTGGSTAAVKGVQANVNLDSRSAIQPNQFTINTTTNIADPQSYNTSTATTIYDSLGNAHTYTFYFQKTDPAVTPPATATGKVVWNVYASVTNKNGTPAFTDLSGGGGVAGAATPLGGLEFDQDGKLVSTAFTENLLGAADTSLGYPGQVNTSQSFTVDFQGSTQYGSPFAVNAMVQDGYASGTLSGFNIGDDGIILGRYTNGQSKAVGQVILANFRNPQGLQPLGNNVWGLTSQSGDPILGSPGSSGQYGPLQSASLEDANVDLTAELVNMITQQRVYQANAQTIKTQDSVLQTLVNLR